jgi:hypothetical protein
MCRRARAARPTIRSLRTRASASFSVDGHDAEDLVISQIAVGDPTQGRTKESEWRNEQPPATWPIFPSDHPLAKSAQKRTTAQALAKDLEDRWDQSSYGALESASFC